MLSSLKKNKMPLEGMFDFKGHQSLHWESITTLLLHPRDCCQSAVWCHYSITVCSTLSMPVILWQSKLCWLNFPIYSQRQKNKASKST